MPLDRSIYRGTTLWMSIRSWETSNSPTSLIGPSALSTSAGEYRGSFGQLGIATSVSKQHRMTGT